MLVYVNQLKIKGEFAYEEALQAVQNWLKQKIKRKIKLDELKENRNFNFPNAKVRTFTAIDNEPLMFSILLSHPDKEVSGRQWITEIGIKQEDNICTVSILLEISDIGTLIKAPAFTTRPGLLYFLSKDCDLAEDTIGLYPIEIKDYYDLNEICKEIYNNNDRDHPIIIVTHNSIDPIELQEQLIGLAQVVYLSDNLDEQTLDDFVRRCNINLGEIKIFHHRYMKRNFGFTKNFTMDDISEIYDNYEKPYFAILENITFITNVDKKRLHYRPTDIRAKRAKDQKDNLKNRLNYKVEENKLELEIKEEDINYLKGLIEIYEQELKNLSENKEEELKINDDEPIYNLSSTNDVLVLGSERELYDSEIRDLAIGIIKNYFDTRQMDCSDRKYIILKDLLEYNVSKGTSRKILDDIKNIFKGYSRMTSSIKSKLNKLGFDVNDKYGEHIKITLKGDNRSSVTIPRTASDHKAGNNIPTQFKDSIFNEFK